MSVLADGIINQVKSHHSLVFRRVLIKRRSLSSGAFESDWFDITRDVKKFGTIKYEADSKYVSRFRFPTASITLANEEGQFNPETSIYSYWYGYLSRQRTLLRIEAGFRKEIDNGDGTWGLAELPADALWDEAYYDIDLWDNESGSAVFTGIIGDDIIENNNNEVVIKVKPLVEVFREYSAKNLTGYNNSLTASDFITMVRDHADANGNKIFLPFFGNTTTGFSITSTNVEYANLSTSTSEDIIDSTVWDVIEKLAESENFLPLVTADGRFRFVSRDSNTVTSAFTFNGLGVYDSSYGHTIKRINSIGPKVSKFYSRVTVRWAEPDTTTSYEIVEATLTVSPPSAAWQYGERTFEIDNRWIPNAAVAGTIASSIFNDYSALKEEIDFSTTFVPGLDLLDQITVNYDISRYSSPQSLWDVGNWADTAGGASTDYDLVWDPYDGVGIYLNNKEYTLISIEMNLDTMECRYIGRES